MRRRDFLAGSVSAGICLAGTSNAARFLYAQNTGKRKELSRPIILPLPTYTAGVKQPVVSLNGTWKISAEAPLDFPRSASESAPWNEVLVPGQADRQGIAIKRGKPYAYRHRFAVPAEFAGSRIFLRFESVSGTAQFWINGSELEVHRGGFTVFNREITKFVKPGEESELAISITDANWDTWPSGFDAGGMLRSVKLVAVPQACIIRLHADTDFDASYTNANLRVSVAVDLGLIENGHISLLLKAPDGSDVALSVSGSAVSSNSSELVLEIPVASPAKWDAEHPNLYTLTASLDVGGKIVTTTERRIGFRKIELRGRKLLVNGSEIKLRGGGRFDSDPHLGHTLTPVQCEEEVQLFKAANLNYIRPACFPAMEEYLDACDRIGMYVEGENNVTFTHGPEQIAALASVFVGQAAEMLETNRSHPCILIWSIGNESNYGPNIQREFDYIHAMDPTRPILFSWSHGVPGDKPLPYSVYSYHYPDIEADMGRPGVAVFNGDGKLWINVPPMPVLHDEFAHLACYDRGELRRDPNVRNFWGEGIKRFWEKMYTTEGCLGGAVWALVDEPDIGNKTFSWGVLDLYRRQRPEYWLLRKAYSPIRIGLSRILDASGDPKLEVELGNWFNHSNLKEVTIEWRIGQEHGTLSGPDIPPRGKGSITVPGDGFRKTNVLELSFHHGGLQVEETRITLEPIEKTEAIRAATPTINANGDSLSIGHEDQQLVIDKSTASLRATRDGVGLLLSGPHFHMKGAELPPWAGTAVKLPSSGRSTVTLQGSFGNKATVHFDLTFEEGGWMRLNYTVDRFAVFTPVERVKPWDNTDKGGFEEVGLSFLLTKDIDYLAWKRRALYTVYPPDHIGRPEGVARRHNNVPPRKFGEKPATSWSLDEQDFDLYGADDQGGRGTNDFRSAKEYILRARAIASKARLAVELESDGKHALRMEAAEDGTKLIILDQWNYNHLGNGNYMRPAVQVQNGHSSSIRFRLVKL